MKMKFIKQILQPHSRVVHLKTKILICLCHLGFFMGHNQCQSEMCELKFFFGANLLELTNTHIKSRIEHITGPTTKSLALLHVPIIQITRIFSVHSLDRNIDLLHFVMQTLKQIIFYCFYICLGNADCVLGLHKLILQLLYGGLLTFTNFSFCLQPCIKPILP